MWGPVALGEIKYGKRSCCVAMAIKALSELTNAAVIVVRTRWCEIKQLSLYGTRGYDASVVFHARGTRSLCIARITESKILLDEITRHRAS